jgi:hypothetical protein
MVIRTCSRGCWARCERSFMFELSYMLTLPTQSELLGLRQHFAVRSNTPYSMSPNRDRSFSFYRVGGDTRISGFLLAIATAILLVIGTGPIAYLRAFRSQPSRVRVTNGSSVCSGYGCRRAHLRPRDRPRQGSIVGHAPPREQVEPSFSWRSLVYSYRRPGWNTRRLRASWSR